MTSAQYRCLIAHVMHWKLGIAEAMQDAGITLSKKETISKLWACGWEYDEVTDSIRYEDDDE